MENFTQSKIAQITALIMDIDKQSTQAAQKTESAYKFLRKTALPLSRKQQRLLHYVIVHKVKDGNGAYSYEVQARYNGNMITVTAATLDEAKALLIAAINGDAQ